MRIVFSSRPAFGHIFSIAPLARAATEAGHDVIFASGEGFLERLRRWGFETRKVGEALDWAFQQASTQWPELLQPEQPEFGARMFVDVLGPRSLSDMKELIEETQPDLVVYEATDIGAGVAAAAAGVPAVCHSLSRSVPVFLDALRDRLHVLWEEAGERASVDVAVGNVFLDIWPTSMRAEDEKQLTQEHWSLRPLAWGDPDADTPAWIRKSNGPLIFVTLGTMFWGKELLVKVIAALEELDCDALVLAGADANPEDLPTRSERVRVAGFVNQAEVLRQASVVIHHGGAGTLLGALAEGLPALAIGAGADRVFTAESLARSGAGIAMNPQSATPREIGNAVLSLLEEEPYRSRAREIQGEIEAMPSPSAVMEKLQSVVSG
jgi:UDP:flavonoid glycosyltransferase YjiC (YdhE family)